MAKLECHFFPGTPASWTCNSCNTDYGDKCIPAGHSRHWGRGQPKCIRCNGDLRYLGSATGAKPFWQMLPHFFAYPLQPNCLLVILLAVCISLLFGMNWITLFLALFTIAVVVKYSFAIIEYRGQGKTTPPNMSTVVNGDEHHLFLRQIAVIFLMGTAIGVAGHFHQLAGVGLDAFLTLAMPASIILLAVEKSVRRALDPRALVSVMLAVGWPYLLLWFCVSIISAGPQYFIGWIAAVLSPSAVMPVVVFIMVYFTFVLYTMLGYVLFEYQSELGFESVSEDDQEVGRAEFDKARTLGESTVLISDGEYVRARECLRRGLDLVRDDVDLHLHYHKLLMLLDDDTALNNHSDYLADLLKQSKMLNKAVPVILDTQSRLPEFKLTDTQTALDVARLLKLQGEYRAAVRLFKNLHKTHPKEPLLPEAYFLVANILFENLGDDGKALAIAQFILSKYPHCSQAPKFEQFKDVVSQRQAMLAG